MLIKLCRQFYIEFEQVADASLILSLRNTDSDGLENFFGCVKSCCQISCSPTPRQFRAGYSTVILNNLASAKSLSSNCEQDASIALLDNVHELILQHNANRAAFNFQANDLYADVICEPESTKTELNFFETESLKYTSTVICSKIVARNSCENCHFTLQVSSESSEHIIIGNGNVPDLTFPSTSFMKIIEKVFDFAIQIIPTFVSEKSIKKVLIDEVHKKYEEEIQTKGVELTVLGCVEHNQHVVSDVFDLTINEALQSFCKNINGLLTGKIVTLPSEPNAIQDLARTFYLKKSRIRKHSDIFKA